jgi:hypothetical protein
MWVTLVDRAKGTMNARFYYESDGQDVSLVGRFDDAGRFLLSDAGGAARFDGTWSVGESMVGVYHGTPQAPFELKRVFADPDAKSVPIIPKRLHREEGQGTANACQVDVDYFEIVGGLKGEEESRLDDAIGPYYSPWGGKCVTGLTDTQRAVVHANRAGLLSFEVRRETRGKGSPPETYDALYCVHIPDGLALRLGDIIAYEPGRPALANLLRPYFVKALRGDAAKASAALKKLGIDTDQPDDLPECLLDADGVRLLWAFRAQNLVGDVFVPTPEGIRIPFDELEKRGMLNETGPLHSFLATR